MIQYDSFVKRITWIFNRPTCLQIDRVRISNILTSSINVLAQYDLFNYHNFLLNLT